MSPKISYRQHNTPGEKPNPAERFDVIIDFSNYSIGTEVTLTNRRGSGKTADAMQFEVTREESDESEIPSTLAPPLGFPDPDDAVETRRFNFLAGMGGGISTINLQSFDPERIDAEPKRDTTEIWELDSDPAHPAHLHLVHFKVLSRNSGPPGPYANAEIDAEDLVDFLGIDFSVVSKAERNFLVKPVDEEVKELLLVDLTVCLLGLGHTFSKQTSQLTGFVKY